MAWGAVVIPGPIPPRIDWRASPIQRARWAKAATSIARPERMPFSKPKAASRTGSASSLKTAQIFEFPNEVAASDTLKGQPLAAHWFVSKSGRTLSDSAIRLLRLKGWLEICLADRSLESEVFVTECRLREQAAFIIADGL